ncbi:MAG TPA: ABC transporter ATP-binding protein [Opitutaceae bacterium]|nr:ABC transporter ATP-binding protein [Opitutaceae bacterium]
MTQPAAPAPAAPVLEVRDLVTTFDTDAGRLTAVDGVSFSVQRGRTLGIVGESGCGKSVTALSIMRLLPQPMGRIQSGEIRFDGLNLATLPPAEMRRIRGDRIGMIFQEPMTALNPVHTIGRQLSEVFLLHRTNDKREALRLSVEMLEKVGIPSPEIRVGEYPHQLSGGMRQRVVIAMALACRPAVVIADEPTTALDVTIQAQILELMQSLQQELGMAIVLITHDLGVIADMCDDVVVMYAGRVAEAGPVDRIFAAPSHPYTRGLLNSIPRLTSRRKSRLNIIEGMVPSLAEMPAGCRFQNRCPWKVEACGVQPPLTPVTPGHTVACHRTAELPPVSVGTNPAADAGSAPAVAAASAPPLEVRDLCMHFPVREGLFQRAKHACRAVDGINLTVNPGETIGLVGESGCGKSTLGKCIVRLNHPTAGQLVFEGTDLAPLSARALKPHRRQLQMIFQDPVESLNARHTVGDIIAEPLVIHGLGDPAWRQTRVLALLAKVGLPANAADRYPFEFSGGQRQRIGIARAIALEPKLIVCDEPVSALDVSIQSQVLNLLLDLQREMGLSYLFIAHNLAVVKHVSDRIAIMYLGRIVEIAGADAIYREPRHPYTRALISAIPQPDPTHRQQRIVLKGDVPSPIHPPTGCTFHTRCPHATDRCKVEAPALRTVGAEAHEVSCHYDL